jgi:hypothetical protein
LERRDWGGRWRARVAPFAPPAIMKTFADVFLAPGKRDFPALPPGYNLLRSARGRVRRLRDRLLSAV